MTYLDCYYCEFAGSCKEKKKKKSSKSKKHCKEFSPDTNCGPDINEDCYSIGNGNVPI